jgi:flavin reductase (DIM6/NTAB) family NADH-FMN oxidoreductase RutF
MSDRYLLTFADGQFIGFVEPNDRLNVGGLVITGRGDSPYGDHRNENLLHLLENFASDEVAPDTPDSTIIGIPVVGQTWFNKATNSLLVFNGVEWTNVSIDRHVTTSDDTRLVSDGIIELERNLPVTGLPDLVIENILHNTEPGLPIPLGPGGFQQHLVQNPAHAGTSVSFIPISVNPPAVLISATNAQDALVQTYTLINDHINNTVAAHDASAIGYIGAVPEPNVQLALENLDTQLDTISGDIGGGSGDLQDHIDDLSDAHDASAISLPVGLGIAGNPTNVQDAIEIINTIVGVGTSGLLEVTRATAAGGQVIGASTKLNFTNVVLGNASNQFSTATSTYTAAFDQEVNITAALLYNIPNNTLSSTLSIRVNGVQRASWTTANSSNTVSPSLIDADFGFELHLKTILSAGDTVEIFASADNPSVVQVTDRAGALLAGAGTSVEFDIVRDLS